MKYVSKQKDGNFNKNLSYGTSSRDENPHQWARWKNYSRRATTALAQEENDDSFSYESFPVNLSDNDLDRIVAKAKRSAHGDYGHHIAYWKIHMRHDKDPSKAKPNTGIKVTQWNWNCVRSTWIHNKQTQTWKR